ncbi:MAG TPA: peptidoglycan-binding domain-containing protein, partial [Marmoricola sp.]
KHTGLIGPLQCQLRNHGFYSAPVTGKWNQATTTALQKFEKAVGLPNYQTATRRVWTALAVHGMKWRELRAGMSQPAGQLVALARSLNAAIGASLHGTGYFGDLTKRAVLQFKKQVFGHGNGVVGKNTWAALQAGKIGALDPSARIAARSARTDVAPRVAADDAAAPSASASPTDAPTPSAAPSPSSSATGPVTAAPSQTASTTPTAPASEATDKPVAHDAADHSLPAHELALGAGANPARSSASGIKPPTRKAAPVRPAVLQARVPDMVPSTHSAKADAAISTRALVFQQLPLVFGNLDVETTRACMLFFPWIGGK